MKSKHIRDIEKLISIFNNYLVVLVMGAMITNVISNPISRVPRCDPPECVCNTIGRPGKSIYAESCCRYNHQFLRSKMRFKNKIKYYFIIMYNNNFIVFI